MSIENLRVKQELIGNNLMEIVDDYPDQLRVIIDELVSHLNDNQLNQIEDLIVNNYGDDYATIVTRNQLKSIKGNLLWTDQTCHQFLIQKNTNY